MKKFLLAIMMMAVLIATPVLACSSPDCKADADAAAMIIGGSAPTVGGSAPVYGGSAPVYGGSAPTVGGYAPTYGGTAITNGGVATTNAGSINVGQGMDVDIDNKNTNTNVNTNTNRIDNTNVNTNVNTNRNDNTNIQGQSQGQAQKQGQGQAQGQMNNWTQTYINEREFLGAPEIRNPEAKILPGGVFEATDMFPSVKGLKRLSWADQVTDIYKTVDTRGMGKVRLHEVVSVLLEVAREGQADHLAYSIWYFDSNKGSSFNIGGGMAMSGITGSVGTSGSSVSGIGFGSTSANPFFVIEFYVVDGWKPVTKVSKTTTSTTSITSVVDFTSGK